MGRTLLSVATLVAVAACGGSSTAETIDREVFIQTYVDLRMAVLDSDSTRLAAGDRDEILATHGVTEDDLLTFAEVHGDDVEFMRDVWNEVEQKLDVTPADAGRPPEAP